MKSSTSMVVLLGSLMLATATGCASGGSEQAAERQVDDATISAGVKAAIAGEPALKGKEIQVGTERGVVQLSGFVSSAEDVATAAAVARTVKGVKSVRNDLRLK